MGGRERSADSLADSLASDSAVLSQIGTHYQVVEELGRGGMACVYRVRDTRTGKSLALKQLLPRDDKHAHERASLFEREFHTLAQLAHPRVIEVYDFGIDPGGAFYTMELLANGDLRERSPIPWREACELAFDVCSSLALLHSRRLVHRDVSPRNVRCTHDGHAKLIDFGAMAPMGTIVQAVGTPPFVAPEAAHATSLDGRTDLFSLGGTLYYALTGRLAYPARTFAQLVECWAIKPAPPSAIVPGIPPQLDRLVMSLISLEAALRPRSAFEVMQRLTSIAGITREEPLSVSQAYLVTPSLVGRDDVVAKVRDSLARLHYGRGRSLLIAAPAGRGRSRVLDACVLEAKTIGCCVLRVALGGTPANELGVAPTLAAQLLQFAPVAAIEAAHSAGVYELLFEASSHSAAANDTAPALKSFADLDRSALTAGIARWLLRASESLALVIVADDVERFDDASIALLATLAQDAQSHALVVLVAAKQTDGTGLGGSLAVLASRCEPTPLRALRPVETEQLLGSVFGDVPNLALLSTRAHALAAGNPREIMQLAQHLVDCGTIRYDAGSWSLPVQLTAAEMPASATDMVRARSAHLGPLARRLAEAQALALEDRFSREDYAKLAPDADRQSLDAALAELVRLQLVTSRDDRYFALDRILATLLDNELTDATRRERYRMLAERAEQSTAPHPFSTARLRMLCGERVRGLDAMLEYFRFMRNRAGFIEALDMPIGEAGRTLLLALATAVELDRNAREQHDLRQWITLLSSSSEDDLYAAAAPAWRVQLEQDSGLNDYRELTDVHDPSQRLMQALTRAGARHAAMRERDRVYPPDEAIRLLVQYVVMSIAESSRRFDMELSASLPALLEPFVELSPLVDAIRQNVLAQLEGSLRRQVERATQRWSDVYERLAHVASSEPEMVKGVRNAIAYAIGANEAALGIGAAIRWAELLDRDPMQRVSAMYLRKIVRLQQGDLDGAEACRRQAELLALQSSVRPMFNNLLPVELGVHATAWDLTGVKQLTERILPLAERYPGWAAFRPLCEGHYLRLLGDLPAAERAYADAIELARPSPATPSRPIVAWPAAVAARTETLIALDRAAEARLFAATALEECERRELSATAFDVVRALGLAEAKLGAYAQAAARIEDLIERQRALGITGLGLGVSYEARARAALWADDRQSLERFGALTAEQYRHGRGSTLGARYERLLDEAQAAGMRVLPPLSPFESSIFGTTQLDTINPSEFVANALAAARDSGDRARLALSLVCKARGSTGGHLFLAADSQLRLAASSMGDAPDDVLQRLVRDFWSQHRDDSEPATAVVSADDLQATQIWTDRKGTTYQPFVLSGVLHGTRMTAGVVLLEGGRSTVRDASEATLFAEIAAFMLREDE